MDWVGQITQSLQSYIADPPDIQHFASIVYYEYISHQLNAEQGASIQPKKLLGLSRNGGGIAGCQPPRQQL